MAERARREPRIVALFERSGRLAWQFVGVAAAVYVLALLFDRLQLVLVALFTAVVASALVVPVSDALERLGLGRSLAAGLGLLLVVAVLGAMLGYVGATIVRELPQLRDDLETQREPTLRWLEQGPLKLSEDEVAALVDQGVAEATDDPEDSTGEATTESETEEELERQDDGRGPSPTLTVTLLRQAFSAAQLAGFGLVGLVVAFFLVRDRDRITDGIVRHAAGGTHESRARRVLRASWRALYGYVRGALLVGAIDAVVIGATLFVIGVPLAGALTLLTFLAGFVPVIGAVVAGLLAVAVTWVSLGTTQAIVVLVVIVVVQQLDGNIMQPLVMENATNLHPIVTIVALLVGGLLADTLGALLAVPTAAVLVNAARVLLDPDDGAATAA